MYILWRILRACFWLHVSCPLSGERLHVSCPLSGERLYQFWDTTRLLLWLDCYSKRGNDCTVLLHGVVLPVVALLLPSVLGMPATIGVAVFRKIIYFFRAVYIVVCDQPGCAAPSFHHETTRLSRLCALTLTRDRLMR